jgi:hypothetical protein
MSDQSPHDSDNDRLMREILDRVAAGELSTADAADLLTAVRRKSAAPEPPPGQQAGPGESAPAESEPSPDAWAAAVDDPRAAHPQDVPRTPQEAGEAGAGEAGAGEAGAGEAAEGGTAEHADVPVPAEVQRVTVRAIGRRVRLIGEPSVAGVAVDGPHSVKREGDTLTVTSDGDMSVSLDGLSMLRARSVGDFVSPFGGLTKELQVRVNPRLQVEVEVTGGSVSAERLPALTRVRVTAGTARVADVDGPIDLLVQAGSVNLDAQLTKGRSRIRVESGSASVHLRRGSDVRVHSEAQLGRVTWTGAVNGPSTDVEIGQGRAALNVEVLMGAAQLSTA